LFHPRDWVMIRGDLVLSYEPILGRSFAMVLPRESSLIDLFAFRSLSFLGVYRHYVKISSLSGRRFPPVPPPVKILFFGVF